jgi:hypothetical protein
MNARQKAKKYKKKINTLESDNDLMRRIIADSPAMQELYDAYNKPKVVTHTTMHFQEYRARRIVPVYMRDLDEYIERTKQAVAEDLFEEIKENITYEVDTECRTPTITASIFIGEKE